ncbi:alpha-mannosidase [Cohnella sp. GCM10027633]|uniref:alpha-mannosidase n=1 Tax=unclassified Cohnella TaxID=2636738 RepID=UPI00364077BC
MIHERHIGKTLGKLRKLEEIYTPHMFVKVGEARMSFLETEEQLYEVPGEGAGWQPAEAGQTWGKPWGSAWFKGTYEIPPSLDGENVYIRARTDAVEALFWVNGVPSGIYTHAKDAESRGNHHTLLLAKSAKGGDSYELAFETYAGHPVVGTQPYQTFQTGDAYPTRTQRSYQSIDVMLRREDVKDFVFDLRALNQIVGSDRVDDFRRGRITNALLEVFSLLEQSPEDEVPEAVWRPKLAKARDVMAPLLAKKNGDSAPKAAIIGHSHMDTAWLWTRDETIRKCARTYANVLSLMDQYPEYMFIQSSAFHAELMRRHYPDIFEGIKRRVAEGRWEPNGGVWIESDCNLVSGESLIRQFLKGQRYTREHFGYTADTFWLPDTFGYSAAIPQIMAGTHVRYFLTTKLSWNDSNIFPYDTFRWSGLDGTTVLTHFNTIHCWPDAGTLIDRVYGPRGNKQNNIMHKQVNDMRFVSYGFGDGGGGPQFEMIESARRAKDLEGVPRTEHKTVSAFMRELEATSVNIPSYVGELYFEAHRGTLTQMHQIKRNNRKAEFAMRNLEFAEVLSWSGGHGKPSSRRDEIYEILLINQFHDILPGTSIPEVHDRAIAEMEEVIRETVELTDSRLSELAAVSGGDAVTVWNTLGWDRSDTIALEGVGAGIAPADPLLVGQRIVDVMGREKLLVGGAVVPGLGATTIALQAAPGMAAFAKSPFLAQGDRVETPYAVVKFDESGYIRSFVDKASGRELVRGDRPLNALLMGEDLPGSWDNWDIDRDVFGKLDVQTDLVGREVATNGPLQLRVRSEYRIGHRSTLKQDIVFHADRAQVDFETVVDWKEKHQLLKVSFDLAVSVMNARHEVQFGHVERPTHTNTPYDQAMFEVCAHKWTDLSENRFGVALLNDCKYGVSVQGSDIQLTLHKGGTHPDPRGDAGIHEMTYSLLPHGGGFGAETVIRPAYELNSPVVAVAGRAAPSFRSFAQVNAPNVIIEAIKPAEDDQAYVIRLYEAERSAVKGAKLRFGVAPSRVALTNMLEEELRELPVVGGEAALDIGAFEIVTVKVWF